MISCLEMSGLLSWGHLLLLLVATVSRNMHLVKWDMSSFYLFFFFLSETFELSSTFLLTQTPFLSCGLCSLFKLCSAYHLCLSQCSSLTPVQHVRAARATVEACLWSQRIKTPNHQMYGRKHRVLLFTERVSKKCF